MNRIYKCFEVGHSYYMYDREKNTITKVSRAAYDVLRNIKNEEEFQQHLAILESYIKDGFLKQTALREIKHEYTDRIEELAENRLSQMILQVTQNCNLRCSYCFYGEGNYINRTHSNKTMSFETAQKAIDYLLSHSKEIDEMYLSFYGGEPLLCVELIRKCITYINENFEGRLIHYNLTTNGTLLTPEIIDFLVKNDIYITISLDGNKEMHDRNRKFANGEGSFEKIMQNVKYLKRNYPEYAMKVGFNTVLAPENDLQCVEEFFSTDEVIGDSLINTGAVTDLYTGENEIDYTEKFKIANKYGIFKALLSAAGKLDSKYTSQLFKGKIMGMKTLYQHMQKVQGGVEIAHPGGPCIAGVRRLFVNVDGKMYPCERVSEKSKAMNIGNLDEGLDYDKVRAILNVGRITKEKCLKCWAFHFCTMCAGYADDTEKLSPEKKLRQCESVKFNTLEEFKDICMLKDFKYDFEGDDF